MSIFKDFREAVFGECLDTEIKKKKNKVKELEERIFNLKGELNKEVAIHQDKELQKKLDIKRKYKESVELAIKEGPNWKFCPYLNQDCNTECECMDKPYFEDLENEKYNGKNTWRCRYKDKQNSGDCNVVYSPGYWVNGVWYPIHYYSY